MHSEAAGRAPLATASTTTPAITAATPAEPTAAPRSQGFCARLRLGALALLARGLLGGGGLARRLVFAGHAGVEVADAGVEQVALLGGAASRHLARFSRAFRGSPSRSQALAMLSKMSGFWESSYAFSHALMAAS